MVRTKSLYDADFGKGRRRKGEEGNSPMDIGGYFSASLKEVLCASPPPTVSGE